MDLSSIPPNITLELKADAVEYLIRETFKNHLPGHEVDKVIFSSSHQHDMRGESCGVKFSGAKVTFKKVPIVSVGWAHKPNAFLEN